MPYQPPRPKLGSILFVRRRTLLSRMIAWCTRGRSEKPTLATHVDMFLNDNTVVGINGGKPYVIPWETYRHDLIRDNADWCIIAPEQEFGETRQLRIRVKVRRLIESVRYGYGELVLQFLDGMIAKVLRRRTAEAVVFRKIAAANPHTYICSTFVAALYGELEDWPHWLTYACPDDILDYVIRDIHEWTVMDHTPEFWLPRER